MGAPAERVCRLYARPELIPVWQEEILHVRDLSGRLDRTGTTYSLVYRIGGGLRKDRHEVTQAQGDRLLQHRGTTPLGETLVATTTLTPARESTGAGWHMEYNLPAGEWASSPINSCSGERLLVASEPQMSGSARSPRHTNAPPR